MPVNCCSSRGRSVFGYQYVTLTFAQEPSGPLHLSAGLAGQIQTAVGRAWPEEVA